MPPRNTKLRQDVATMPDGNDDGPPGGGAGGADGHKGLGKDGHLRLNFAGF